MNNSPFKVLIISTLLITLSNACKKEDDNIDFRNEMRRFIIGLSHYSKQQNPDFIVVPQNGQELITDTGEANGTIMSEYIEAIDATAREDLLFGYFDDDQPSPSDFIEFMTSLCSLYTTKHKPALVIDYCFTPSKIDYSYTENHRNGFISFAATERNLNIIPSYPPEPFGVNNEDINNIEDIKNFLYLINGENFETKQQLIESISATNFDLLILDLFHFDEALTPSEIAKLQQKTNGSRRLVLCYMSIGEAENYRYYWEKSWNNSPPRWLCEENKDWAGNYEVKYWDKEWQQIIYGTPGAYLDRILKAGFDGVYLDLVDAFEYFEE